MAAAACELAYFESVASTNEVVKQAIAQGKAAGFTSVALEQTGGYGRQGRVWESPRGGLYASVLLRPQAALDQIPSFSLVAALALRRVLVDEYGANSEKVLVKWPNDLVTPCEGASFGKLAGISCELVGHALCAGFGVNILRSARVQTDGRYEAAYLEDIASAMPECVNYEEAFRFARKLSNALREACVQWEQEGFAAFMPAYEACSYLADREVALINALDQEQVRGVVRGVDAQGNVLVEGPTGTISAVCAGEAHVVG